MTKRTRFNIQAIILVLLTVLAVYILLRSSVFSIKTIEITGLNLLTEKDILNSLSFQYGDNIFSPDLPAEQAALQSLPLLKEAEVSRKLPSRIKINLVERVPLALLMTEGRCIQVDEEGIYLREGTYGDSGLPLINNLNLTVGQAGQKVEGEYLAEVLAGIWEMPLQLRAEISEVNYSANEGFVLYTLSGIQCFLGFPEDMTEKGTALVAILDNVQSQGRQVEYINLAYLGSPVIKYAQ